MDEEDRSFLVEEGNHAVNRSFTENVHAFNGPISYKREQVG